MDKPTEYVRFSTMIWKPHVTVAAIIEKNGRFLLIEENVAGHIVINQPAGHLDEGESLVTAVIRETREETAYLFKPEAITGIYRWQHPENHDTYLRVAYCGNTVEHDPDAKLDSGIIKTIWLTREALLKQDIPLRNAMVLQCIDDYLAGTRYPLELIHDLLPSDD